MKLFGLTGNIGCGKSTVAKLLVVQGDIVVFDCDKIAKEIIASDAVRQDLVKIVGLGIFSNDYTVDWKKLARIIFSDRRKKFRLEHLVHPLVRETIAQEAECLSQDMIGIVESAIIYETSWSDAFNGVVVATCGRSEQVRRLKESRNMSEEDIFARTNAQLPQYEKEHRANFVISTDCSPMQLESNVIELYNKLK